VWWRGQTLLAQIHSVSADGQIHQRRCNARIFSVYGELGACRHRDYVERHNLVGAGYALRIAVSGQGKGGGDSYRSALKLDLGGFARSQIVEHQDTVSDPDFVLIEQVDGK